MKEEKQKFYSDKEKLIENELADTKEIMSKMFDKLPNEELPFMEPHLRALYFETYFLLAKGFYNASLVLMGILLETIVKEKLFMEGIKDEELEGKEINFGKAIKTAKEMNLLTEDELSFLEIKKDKLRNPYAHYNKMKISKDKYFEVKKIPNFVDRFKELYGKVKNKELTEEQFRAELVKDIKSEPMSSKEFRPLAQLAKSEIDKKQAIPIFLEIDKFVRRFAEKYFNPEKQKI